MHFAPFSSLIPEVVKVWEDIHVTETVYRYHRKVLQGQKVNWLVPSEWELAYIGMFAEMMKGVGEHDTIGRHHVHCACVCVGGWSVRWVGWVGCVT